VAKNNVQGFWFEQFMQLVRIRPAEGDSLRGSAGLCFLPGNPEHFFGAIKEHDLKAHLCQSHTHGARAAT
jgi:hypothetical protein